MATLPGNRLITYERTVQAGVPFLQTPYLRVDGSAIGPGGADSGAGSFNVDFGGSAYWNGVSSVTMEGVPVSGFSLSNSDGVDFTSSFALIPEPEHYAALAGTGLLAFALGRRAKNRF